MERERVRKVAELVLIWEALTLRQQHQFLPYEDRLRQQNQFPREVFCSLEVAALCRRNFRHAPAERHKMMTVIDTRRSGGSLEDFQFVQRLDVLDISQLSHAGCNNALHRIMHPSDCNLAATAGSSRYWQGQGSISTQATHM